MLAVSFSKKDVESLVDTTRDSGAFIPDDDARKIIEYLSSRYTPETRKR
jgi:hypothetical protein